MNKKGQWNIGFGVALILGGIYLLTRGTTETVILGIVLIGIGTWMVFREKERK